MKHFNTHIQCVLLPGTLMFLILNIGCLPKTQSNRHRISDNINDNIGVYTVSEITRDNTTCTVDITTYFFQDDVYNNVILERGDWEHNRDLVVLSESNIIIPNESCNELSKFIDIQKKQNVAKSTFEMYGLLTYPEGIHKFNLITFKKPDDVLKDILSRYEYKEALTSTCNVVYTNTNTINEKYQLNTTQEKPGLAVCIENGITICMRDRIKNPVIESIIRNNNLCSEEIIMKLNNTK